MMQQGRRVSMEEKLRYMREVENIYRLSKKVLPPKGTTWAAIADQHLHKALGLDVREPVEPMRIKQGQSHGSQDRTTARMVERTLRNGVMHPDILMHYQHKAPSTIAKQRPRRFYPRPERVDHQPDVMHMVQHGIDLEPPSGHLQGFGFVPKGHADASHVPLEPAGAAESTVPTAGPPGYH